MCCGCSSLSINIYASALYIGSFPCKFIWIVLQTSAAVSSCYTIVTCCRCIKVHIHRIAIFKPGHHLLAACPLCIFNYMDVFTCIFSCFWHQSEIFCFYCQGILAGWQCVCRFNIKFIYLRATFWIGCCKFQYTFSCLCYFDSKSYRMCCSCSGFSINIYTSAFYIGSFPSKCIWCVCIFATTAVSSGHSINTCFWCIKFNGHCITVFEIVYNFSTACPILLYHMNVISCITIQRTQCKVLCLYRHFLSFCR